MIIKLKLVAALQSQVLSSENAEMTETPAALINRERTIPHNQPRANQPHLDLLLPSGAAWSTNYRHRPFECREDFDDGGEEEGGVSPQLQQFDFLCSISV